MRPSPRLVHFTAQNAMRVIWFSLPGLLSGAWTLLADYVRLSLLDELSRLVKIARRRRVSL